MGLFTRDFSQTNTGSAHLTECSPALLAKALERTAFDFNEIDPQHYVSQCDIGQTFVSLEHGVLRVHTIYDGDLGRAAHGNAILWLNSFNLSTPFPRCSLALAEPSAQALADFAIPTFEGVTLEQVCAWVHNGVVMTQAAMAEFAFEVFKRPSATYSMYCAHADADRGGDATA